MKVKIIKPVQGLGYFANDVAELPEDTALKIVESGFGALIPNTEGKEGEDDNNLPEDLPMRDLLFKQGYNSVETILKNEKTLVDVPGIGKKTADKIVEFCQACLAAEGEEDK